ncbi:mediator complex subunit Pmc2/Med1 [Schizosaccharomyces cryophilus OY26]|uniref:Mediator of RNA polymerase II transcription subunit 1 n=1 Tax=Schizosaccharomyces cryophilus (strain OY26 / ATCC MYA-4695 / CBS 11777 / NBRC 106824 / NRRL Y48691) TaxID=653667 RepID=S9W278_SCHCR|nr:mediator complex subunit Pmc2/Med1 [Schizosaccharomyces cryophilus OY26]EPY54148.1 mediator complex subunit Pmc2/Med1 [Schizosaccharomyces cryophilus OY26]
MEPPNILSRIPYKQSPLNPAEFNLTHYCMSSLLSIPWNDISATGFEYLAKKYRLDVFSDTSNSNEVVLSLAGKIILIDVIIPTNGSHKDIKIALAFADATGEQYKNTAAEDILQSAIHENNTILLERNVALLAALDRCSPSVQQSCFQYLEALKSAFNLIYASRLRSQASSDETEIIMSAEGKPLNDNNGNLGLQLAFWKYQDSLYTAKISMNELPSNSLPSAFYGANLVSETPLKISGEVNWLPETTMTQIPATMELLFEDSHFVFPEFGVQSLLSFLQITDVNLSENFIPYKNLLNLPNQTTAGYPSMNKSHIIYLGGIDIPARSVHRIPFSHPRQILGIFQHVRQYLALQTIFENVKLTSTKITATASLRLNLIMKQYPMIHMQYQELNKLSNVDPVIANIAVLPNGIIQLNSITYGTTPINQNDTIKIQKMLQKTLNIGLVLEFAIPKLFNNLQHT